MKLLKIKQVTELTTMSRSTIYRMISDGKFPKQVCLEKNISVWLESEIHGYIAERIANR
jgi:prophage regulatory protein